MNPGHLGQLLPFFEGTTSRIPIDSFRAIFEWAPIGIGLVDSTGVTHASNPMLEQLLGYSEDELRGIDFNDITHPEDIEPNATLFNELLQGTRDRFSVEKRMFRRNGEIFWARVTASLIRPVDSTPEYALGMLEDISEQKLSQERNEHLLAELQEAKARFKGAFDSSPLGMDITTPDGFFVQVNRALCDILGYDEHELLSMRWQDVTHPDDLEASLHSRNENLAGVDVLELRKRYVHKSGRVLWCRLNSSMVRDHEDRPLYMVSQIADITHEVELEKRLRHAQKMEAVGRLAGGISHDFNNLLQVINNYAAFLAEDMADDDPRRDDAVEIVRAGQRAARLVHQLLAFSRKEASLPTPLSINDVVNDLESLLRRSIGERISLVLEPAAEVPDILIDPTHVEQILVNLAVNARDAMPDGGSLIIRTTVHDSNQSSEGPVGTFVCLEVTDSGHGIPDDVLPNVFEPFFTTKARGEGTGLGLATVYGIVQQANGHIGVVSTSSSGTTFRILLPAI